MKQIKCSEMGGPETCNEVITGANAQEMIDVGWKHLQEAHPEVSQKIMNNPKDENDKWMDDFKANFENLQDA
jgi:hypothetical protein